MIRFLVAPLISAIVIAFILGLVGIHSPYIVGIVCGVGIPFIVQYLERKQII
ncbi:hypothetical protein R84981_000537 [Carnimonas sp. R-84981]|uniref:hypothetical protein n=1 Tax=Carnimonas bestiolae TaxID=3402172 RepID=UPI003EDB6D76